MVGKKEPNGRLTAREQGEIVKHGLNTLLEKIV
jgi:hypothetical protein